MRRSAALRAFLAPLIIPAGALVLTCQLACEEVPELIEPTRTQADCLASAVFPDPATSDFCLPFPPGTVTSVSQSYCSPPGRSHHTRFAIDFVCALGDPIVAARGGLVEFTGDEWPDDDPTSGHENRAVIRHADGTVAVYVHFRQRSLVVQGGDSVTAGQLLGDCGSSGTPSAPHLHFETFERAAYEIDRGLPVSFRNADGPLDSRGGLEEGASYVALPCN
jgi:murein DD-endopeptidase MepM/ murein hydrolase activator NlpD